VLVSGAGVLYESGGQEKEVAAGNHVRHKTQFILLLALIGAAEANQLWSLEEVQAYCDLLNIYIEDVRRIMQAVAQDPDFYVSSNVMYNSLNGYAGRLL
jgi:hypothetical protein